MSLMSALYVGKSGLTTSQNALNTTGNNLANVRTEGYVRQQVVQADTYYTSIGLGATTSNQLGLGVDVAEIRRVRDMFMDQAFRRESGRQAFYETSYAAISEIETLFGELEGVEVSTALTDLWSSIQELTKTPNDSTALALFRDAADEFVERCTDVYSGLKEFQSKLNVKIEETVDEINQLGYSIYTLNKQILNIESGGVERANDLRDLRDNALDKLGALVHIDYKETPNGYIVVDIEGKDFVTPMCYYEMGMRYDAQTELVTPIWPHLEGEDVFDFEIPISSKLNTDIGELKAYIFARGVGAFDYSDMPEVFVDTSVPVPEPDAADTQKYPLGDQDPAYISDLKTYNEYKKMFTYENNIAQSAIGKVMVEFDQLFHSIVTGINDILSPNKSITADDGTTYMVLDEENCSYSASGEMGIELFSRIGYERYTEKQLTVNGTTKTYRVYNEENTDHRGTMYTLGNVIINEDVMQDETLLPMTTKTGDADHDRAIALVDKWMNRFGKLTPDSAEVDYQTYYVEMVGGFASLGSVYKAASDALTTASSYIDQKRQQVMGVSSDEELTNMIRYQNAYNAASRYFTVVSDMLEYLISQLGTR